MSVQTVTAPTSGEMGKAGGKNITTLANSAAQGNVQGLGTALAGMLELFQTGGGLLMDPSLRGDYDKLNASVNKATAGDLKNLEKWESELTTWQTRVSELNDKKEFGDGLSTKEQKELTKLTERISTNEKNIASAQTRIDDQRARITTWEETNLQGGQTAADLLAEKFPEAAQALQNAMPYLEQAGQLGPAGQQLMETLRGGYQSGNIGWQGSDAAQSAQTSLGAAPLMGAERAANVAGPQAARAENVANVQAGTGQAAQGQLTQGQAANMGNVANVQAQNVQGAQAAIAQGQAAKAGFVSGPQAAQVSAAQMQGVRSVSPAMAQAAQMGAARNVSAERIAAGQVGQGALGAALMNRALGGVQNAGRLDAQASRDAIQSARQGMAARGLATGSGAMAAEFLNRDRYRRQREFEDLNFAGQTQQADLTRQFQNVGNQLAAAQANQGTGLQAQMANQQADLTGGQFNAGNQQQVNLANQGANMSAQQLNQAADITTNQTNAGLIQEARLANQSATNQMALAGYQGSIDQGQFNAGNEQQMNLANLNAVNAGNQFNAANQQQAVLANQDANLQAATVNQQTQFGTNQFNAGNQQAINLANMNAANNMAQFNASNQQDMSKFVLGNELQAGLANQNVSAQLSLANQGAANEMTLAGYTGQINQNQFNASQNQAANAANQGTLAEFGLTQGQLNQQNNQFNAGQLQQNNQFNATGALNAAMSNEEAQRLGNQMNVGMLGDAFNTEQSMWGQGLGAALQQGQLASAANPYSMLANMYSTGQPVGSQSIGPAASMANTWSTNALGASMFNANANNWADAMQQYGNYGNQQSGMGSAIGGLGGMALGAGVGALLAAPTGGMSITTGAMLGAGLGGGAGAGIGGLLGR